MYGYFDPVIIYGFLEGNRDQIISDEWLNNYGINSYASDVVKLYCGEVVYGILASLDAESGKVEISDEDKKLVDIAANVKNTIPGFHLALIGDYQHCHDEYNPES